MFKKIAIAIVEKKFFKKIRKKIIKIFKTIAKIINTLLSVLYVNIVMRQQYKVDNKIIFFTNFSGEFDCNPGYICKELLKRKNDYKLVYTIWGGKKKTKFLEQFPNNIELVERFSYQYYVYLCSAKMIIDNGTSFYSARYKIKNNQILISTWHGSLGIKKSLVGINRKDIKYNNRAKKAADMVDYIISNSTFENSFYRETFWPNTPIMMLGHARNDILFNKNNLFINQIKSSIKEIYNIPKNSRMCLYAPTFRDNDVAYKYNIDYEQLKLALTRKFGGKWVILTKYHFRAKYHLQNKKGMPTYVYNVSDYPDIQELLAAIDVGITDYSSWICEYIHTKKPGFLYATDIEDYNMERGFYDPLDKMPFPLSTNDDELYKSIMDFDQKKYENECDDFLKKKGCVDDGLASARICDQIDLLMNNEPVSCKLY